MPPRPSERKVPVLPHPFPPSSVAPRVVALFTAAFAVAGLALVSGAHGCTVLTNDALPDDAAIDGQAEAGAACSGCFASACAGLYAACFGSEACIAQRFCGSGTAASDAGDAGDATADAAPDAAVSPGAGASTLYPHILACQSSSSCVSKVQACAAPFAASCALDAGSDGATDAASLPDADAVDAAPDAGQADADIVDATASDAPSSDAVADAAPTTCTGCAAQCASAGCGAGTACDAFVKCGLGCGSAVCVAGCGTANAAGKAAATQVARCVTTNCAALCGQTE